MQSRCNPFRSSVLAPTKNRVCIQNPGDYHCRMLRIIFCLLLGLGTTFGGLAWERPLQEFHAIPEDGFVETTFTFKNTGSSPVRIRKVQSSCGCTTTKLDKRDFAPGETGELKAKFTFRGRRGAQRKTIQVITDDGTETVLDFRVGLLQQSLRPRRGRDRHSRHKLPPRRAPD
jgi:hypothetical protein